MRRRQFITLLASLAIYRPCTALARVASKPPRIGFLAGGSRPDSFGTSAYAGFLQGMKELGNVEERDFVMEWRFAEGQYDRFPSLVAELVRLPVDIVVVGTPAAVKLVQQATRTIPIVMGLSTDPVASGFVDSLARPGGNTTGVATSQEEICLKHLSILKVLVPEVSLVGFAKNPGNPSHSDVQRILERAASGAGYSIQAVEMRKPEDIEIGFNKFSALGVGAVVFSGDGFLFAQRQAIAAIALKARMPTIFTQQEYVEAGGLISYGDSLADNYRRTAFYVDKILRGAKPSELPIQQPNNFVTVINRKTAFALGLSLPEQLLVLADQVIE